MSHVGSVLTLPFTLRHYSKKQASSERFLCDFVIKDPDVFVNFTTMQLFTK